MCPVFFTGLVTWETNVLISSTTWHVHTHAHTTYKCSFSFFVVLKLYAFIYFPFFFCDLCCFLYKYLYKIFHVLIHFFWKCWNSFECIHQQQQVEFPPFAKWWPTATASMAILWSISMFDFHSLKLGSTDSLILIVVESGIGSFHFALIP